jgi:3',5'-cyclic AMP phosphodiesterase CpdA
VRQTGIIILMFLAVASARADDCDLARCPIRFAILGDRTGGHVDHIFDSVVVEVERLRPDFVMTVGDMIEGYASDTAVYAEEWREFQKIVAPLTMPIHYTPGNHDITNDVGLAPFRKYVGEPVYSFDYRGLHIAVLDNSRLESTDGWPQEQLDWLTADLKAHQDAAYTMVFFHKPFWYNTVFQGRPD